MASWEPHPREWVERQGGDPSDPGTTFTVVTYNVLSDSAMPQGTYEYCPQECRYMDVRHVRIMLEIDSMSPDVVCMQEVAPEHYTSRLQPDMEARGFSGVYLPRRDKGQGLANFYRRDVFELSEYRETLISDLAIPHIQRAEISEEDKENLRSLINKFPNVTLITKLLHKNTNKTVTIGNIHVTWSQLKYPALQAMQISTSLNEIVEVAGEGSPLIFCGDFNTPPDFPAYQMLTDSGLNESSIQWLKDGVLDQSDLRSGPSNLLLLSSFDASTFSLRSDLASAYKVMGSEPSITNCDDACQDYLCKLCLDYLWFSPSTLGVSGVLETPSEEHITLHHAMPSKLFPSDHIPLKARFFFK